MTNYPHSSLVFRTLRKPHPGIFTILATLILSLAVAGCGDPSLDTTSQKDDPTNTEEKIITPPHLAQLTNSLGAVLVYLEGGTFTMGSPENETRRDLDEHLHQVKLTRGFYFWSTEVTQKQWKEIMQSEPWLGGAYTRSGDQLPAGAMSIAEAMSFCSKLTEIERTTGTLPKGFEYRLPTEAEWEYACRAGSQTAYFSGNDDQTLKKIARFNLNSEGLGVLQVATRKPNSWGLYDMHGNVWEFCLDQAEWEVGPNAIRHLVNDAYRDGVIDPQSKKGSEFVRRGGAWNTPAYQCRSANRSGGDGNGEWPDHGIRPVLAPVPEA